MSTQVFISLPTNDLDRSKAFYEAVGWAIQPNFTDENAACIQADDNFFVMVLKKEYFATFTDKPIVDPGKSIQVQTALSQDSRAAVDALLEKALAAGGTEPRPAQELGFMYSRDFEDPDGNLFGAIWMDPQAAAEGPESFMAEQQEEGLGHS
ncbi:putative lactoylglutathione lyase [Arthrobacter stackebrandtii]|uniref:Lactoylglutathione lyase n=1 Tax=Arthrobacter stackebrandtii TaxID=272161 RepID=A0ABS4YWJ6_9MICC|nr:VOC family protein [Arthrobacter stackebrandtii]MBP2413148.1 putative lactoylglutathione lyase [Arthrobacter stackebrandtii]PYH01375.1 glyoxalase [Arthrobacter stackebrandtii]